MIELARRQTGEGREVGVVVDGYIPLIHSPAKRVFEVIDYG